MVAAQKEKPAGEGVYCIALTADERGPILEQEHCFDQHAAYICFSPASLSPNLPISFQSFLQNTVPTLQQRLLGAQYMWAAHGGEDPNFTVQRHQLQRLRNLQVLKI